MVIFLYYSLSSLLLQIRSHSRFNLFISYIYLNLEYLHIDLMNQIYYQDIFIKQLYEILIYFKHLCSNCTNFQIIIMIYYNVIRGFLDHTLNAKSLFERLLKIL